MSEHLLKDFYRITSSNFSPGNTQFQCDIELNPTHPVYKGHFEQMPVAPGVCLVQMIKEIVAENYNEKLIFESADNIKFLAPINPKENNKFLISFTLKQEAAYQVTATIAAADITFVKFKGKFVRVSQ